MADRTRTMEVKVGGLILTAVLLLIGFLILLGDFQCREQAQARVDFPSSSDLKTGAPVKVSGVTVGKVVSVDLWGGRPDPENDNRSVGVRVTLKLDPAAARLLRADATFRITTLGILGEKYVEIFPGTQDAAPVGTERPFTGLGPMNLDAVGADAGSLVVDMSGMLRENRQNLKDSIEGIKRLLTHVDEVLLENRPGIQAVVANLERLSKGLGESTRDGQEVRDTLVAIRTLAEHLDKGLAPTLAGLPGAVRGIDRLADQGSSLAAELLTVVSGARPELAALLANVRLLTQNLRDGKGSVGALLSDRELYDDLIALMKDVKRHPWKLLLKE
jgi:phospholipid/cholesterol/gamma-HCH transport system substrate-binding protein